MLPKVLGSKCDIAFMEDCLEKKPLDCSAEKKKKECCKKKCKKNDDKKTCKAECKEEPPPPSPVYANSPPPPSPVAQCGKDKKGKWRKKKCALKIAKCSTKKKFRKKCKATCCAIACVGSKC